MKRKLIRCLNSLTLWSSAQLLIWVAGANGTANGRPERMSLKETAPQEVLVRFSTREHRTLQGHQKVLSRLGYFIQSKFVAKPQDLHKVKIPSGKTLSEALRELEVLGNIEAIQPNFKYQALKWPNDPETTNQWSLKNTAQAVQGGRYTIHNPGIKGNDLGFEAVWDLLTDCSSTIVAIVDTGINYLHQDLIGNMWDGGPSFPKHGFDFVRNTTDPMDRNGHGTHLAGIVGATGDNHLGGTGTCWKSKLMAVRVLDASGAGDTLSIVDGIEFALAHGAKVINLSLGGPSDGGAQDKEFEKAIINANSKGAVVVVAAGNDGLDNDAAENEQFPCNFHQPGLICVAALDQSFRLAGFSNYGTVSVAVGAPGTNIFGTEAGDKLRLKVALDSGWKRSPASSVSPWSYALLRDERDNAFPSLVNPPGWDGSVRYGNNLDERITRTFDLSDATSAVFEYSIYVDLANPADEVTFAMSSLATDPFDNIQDGFRYRGEGQLDEAVDLAECSTEVNGNLSSNCAIGFRLKTDASVTATGSVIFDTYLRKLKLNPVLHSVGDGTSFSAPYVSGIVALLYSFNPNFQLSDVVQAVKGGGIDVPDLKGTTSTGKVAHAMGSLSFIAPPEEVKATVIGTLNEQ